MVKIFALICHRSFSFRHIVTACIRHLFVLIQPDKVHIELIHKKLWQVIVRRRHLDIGQALVHKRFRF